MVDSITGFGGPTVDLFDGKCNAFERELKLEVLGRLEALELDQSAGRYRSANDDRGTYDESWGCDKPLANQPDGSCKCAADI